MERRHRSFGQRISSAQARLQSLSALRRSVGLPPANDIKERQWAVIEAQLSASELRLQSRIKRAARLYLPQLQQVGAARALNTILGEVDFEAARAFDLFDTYMDVLTQRLSVELGAVLQGCDALAWEGIQRDHPALAIVEPPLVYCDRGFGASVLREHVLFPDRTPNPLPLIAIPYSRLREKYNLTSVLHEVGHEAMIRLGLKTSLPAAVRVALKQAGASPNVTELFALWMSEIGPDFWTFCSAGPAQPAGLRDILSLAPAQVFRLSWTDPHPPPYIRVLLCFAWCRHQWGAGEWDKWTEEWEEWYPLATASPNVRELLTQARQAIPVVTRTLFRTRYRVLNHRTIPALFDLSKLSPERLRTLAARVKSGAAPEAGTPPSVQLAAFRVARDEGGLSERALDERMTIWLKSLTTSELVTSAS